jgi:hypothetical protein
MFLRKPNKPIQWDCTGSYKEEVVVHRIHENLIVHLLNVFFSWSIIGCINAQNCFLTTTVVKHDALTL